MHIFDFFRDIFSVLGAFSRFFGVKFGFRKSCLCIRNDKYEVWLSGFDTYLLFYVYTTFSHVTVWLLQQPSSFRIFKDDMWLPRLRSSLIWNICAFFCKKSFFDKGGLQSQFHNRICHRGSPESAINNMSHFGPFLRVLLERWPQFMGPP